MSDERPPPYLHPSQGAAVSSQPAAYPGQPYQTFPQSYSGGGDQSYYQGPPGPPGPYQNQPGVQGYYNGPPQTNYPYSEDQKQTVFENQQSRRDDDDDDNDDGSCHCCRNCCAACAACLCCCCVIEMLS